ncbi:SIS domain-containing protein [Rhodopseudomonas palustris]|nr:SIS domain-containing protein [Rhodopseudomonas palustris]
MGIVEYLEQSERVLAAARGYVGTHKVNDAVEVICRALGAGKPLLVCGNGGSACDAMHITGELVGRFLKERRALNCICLSSNPAVLTAWSNDYSFETVFSRQVEAYGAEAGVILGISTSGNSANVIEAFRAAHELKMTTIGLTGEGGGKMAAVSDVLIDVPSRSTPLIQQVHVCLYHYICEHVEARLFT